MTDSTIPLEQHLNEISKWEKNIANLSNEIVYLKEQIEWFKRQIFGQKTEKFVEPNQNADQLLFEGFDKLVPVEMKKSTPLRLTNGQSANQMAKIPLLFLMICLLNAE